MCKNRDLIGSLESKIRTKTFSTGFQLKLTRKFMFMEREWLPDSEKKIKLEVACLESSFSVLMLIIFVPYCCNF